MMAQLRCSKATSLSVLYIFLYLNFFKNFNFHIIFYLKIIFHAF
jgi:hypothetical protein